MKEFLFGWLIKPDILQTPLDDIVCTIEILILIFVIIPIGIEIMGKIEDFFDKGKERKMKKEDLIILIITITSILAITTMIVGFLLFRYMLLIGG